MYNKRKSRFWTKHIGITILPALQIPTYTGFWLPMSVLNVQPVRIYLLSRVHGTGYKQR